MFHIKTRRYEYGRFNNCITAEKTKLSYDST